MKIDLPKIHLGSNVLSDFNKAIQMEWIITNGLGGYASSTALGINTRKYHGLLVAAFNPPTDRNVLLTKLDEEVKIEDKTYSIGSNEFDCVIQPEGHRFLSDFSLNPFPTYGYSIDKVQLQKKIFMLYGKNATVIDYELFNPTKEKVDIRIFPLVNYRHFHTITDKDKLNWKFIQKPVHQGVNVYPSIPLSNLIIYSSDGKYHAGKDKWIRHMHFRVDHSRGESCRDDSFQPGCFELNVVSEEKKKFFIVVAAGKTESEAKHVFSSISKDVDALRHQELSRQEKLLEKFQEHHRAIQMEDWLKWMILAADSFIVNRESIKAKSVIAGYHWFEDWGRDSLIALPGLTLATGRFEDAKKILLTFKHYCCRGIIPNHFPDHAGENPAYNTVDATGWYFNAVLQYLKYTGDIDFVRKQMWSFLRSIVKHHCEGTLYNICLDDDGLIAHGPQLTWMDAMMNQEAVTPRDGKAVEVQALWYNALKIMGLLATRFNQKEQAEEYSAMAEKAKESFVKKFWNPQAGWLFDVVKDKQQDASLRPNQIISAALDFSMLDKTKEEKIVDIVWKKLFATYGLKTLSEEDSRYIGKYLGGWNHRHNAYHNGTVWAWLLGPFTTAFLKVKNYEERWRVFARKTFLQPLFQKETFQAGLGTISEIFDGDSPYTSRGGIAQAWSVAEPLRAFVEDVMLKRPPYEQTILGNSPV